MRVYRLIRELKEVHDLELELLSVLIIIGVRSGKEKRKTKRDSHCRQQTTAGWWSTRFNFGSASRIEKKHTRGRQNKCVLKRYALGGQRNENEIKHKTENWSDWTKVKAINQWPRTRVRLDVFFGMREGDGLQVLCVLIHRCGMWGLFFDLERLRLKEENCLHYSTIRDQESPFKNEMKIFVEQLRWARKMNWISTSDYGKLMIREPELLVFLVLINSFMSFSDEVKSFDWHFFAPIFQRTKNKQRTSTSVHFEYFIVLSHLSSSIT